MRERKRGRLGGILREGPREGGHLKGTPENPNKSPWSDICVPAPASRSLLNEMVEISAVAICTN